MSKQVGLDIVEGPWWTPIAYLSMSLLALLFVAWVLPKVRVNPVSPGITNNTWSGHIRYSSADGQHVIICDFMGHDSAPYWEGGGSWQDEQVCGALPVYVHQGLPPNRVLASIEGRVIELRAPILWGRLL